MQKGVVVDLLDEEIRYVGARDEPPCPAARIDQRAIGVRLRPIGQDHGTHDHPVELAPADDAFLQVLVVIDAPQQQMKRPGRQLLGRFQPLMREVLARAEKHHAPLAFVDAELEPLQKSADMADKRCFFLRADEVRR
jgi:hypothetical protein